MHEKNMCYLTSSSIYIFNSKVLTMTNDWRIEKFIVMQLYFYS